MMKIIAVVFVLVGLGSAAFGQTVPAVVAKPDSKFEKEIALAKLALEAHGGEKLKKMSSLVLRGSVDFTSSAFNQKFPATFYIVIAKEKYRFEILNQFQPLKQVFDGVNTSSAVQGGFTLPPVTRLGFPVLPMVGEQGYVITPLPDDKKKRHGFRMTTPDGYFTDFFLDEKTNLIKGYNSTYDINGRVVTTSVEVEKNRVVDGITVPEKYAQRIDVEQMTVYVDFKSKDILVNTAIADDVFSVGK